MDEGDLSKYLNHWMNETGFERILQEKATEVLDVYHIKNPNGDHQTAIVCSKRLVLLFPPAE